MAEYIEREAAEKILYDGCHTMNGNEGPDDVVEMWHMVQAIPSADVAPVRHGRWVKTIGENGEIVAAFDFAAVVCIYLSEPKQ